MEKDTVLLTVEEYNRLRDFKKEVEESLKESMLSLSLKRNIFAYLETLLKNLSFLSNLLMSNTNNRCCLGSLK